MNEYMREFYKDELEKNYSEGEIAGEAKGRAEETTNSIRKVMKNFKLSAEAAMEALEIPKTDFPKYLAML